MKYRSYGNTGVMVPALGFGCMRLPMKDEQSVDREKAIPLLHRAYELGIDYFDTGKWYCGQNSERTLGEALKGMDRSRLRVSTKYAHEHSTGADLREKFETSLRLLDIDYVDFYHVWGISWSFFTDKLDVPGGPLSEFVKLKDEGLVKHLSFSFHSEPEDIPKLVDTGIFETMLCQYNLLDRRNDAGIAYAASKGLGVAIMGPVAGGRLSAPSQAITGLLRAGKPASSPEIALRFVLANPNVSMALSGMSSIEQLEENVETASREEYLSEAELDLIERSARENQKMMDLYCTGCKYCMPCPQEVRIPYIFQAMNYDRVWGLGDYARRMYSRLSSGKVKGKDSSACIECGECEQKCPQHIPIIEQLKESHAALST